MHEIVTLQFGQRANYLATHFWNIQESYFTYAPNALPSVVDHDINFRPGIGTDGSDTYTPRTVIYDLKGGFGTLKQQNALYDDSSSSSQRFDASKIWGDNGLSTIKQQPIQPIPYQQNLEAGLPTSQLHKSQIRYWSDFNRVFFHPRSIVQLNEYSLNSSIAPFENWTAGEELFRDVDREADLLDRDVRPFVEECDSMQGLQIFAGADDAWGGWASRYIDVLRDEYGKKSIWLYGIEDNKPTQRDKALAKQANVAKTLSEVGRLASVYTRLGTHPSHVPSYLNCDFSNDWESSALMAAAVESATLPTRLRDTVGITERSTMPQYEQLLSSDEGRNIWELGISLDREPDMVRTNGNGSGNTTITSDTDPRAPQRNNDHGNLQPTEDLPIDIEPTTPDIIFTPSTSHLLPQTSTNHNRTRTTPVQTHTFTQLTTSRHPIRPSSTNSTNQPTSLTLTQENLLQLRYADLPIVQRYDVPLSFPLLDAYPSPLFATDRPQTDNLSLTAAFTTATSTKDTIFQLRDLVTRHSRVIGVDEREDLYNELTGLGEKYNFGFEADDDEEMGWDSGEELV